MQHFARRVPVAVLADADDRDPGLEALEPRCRRARARSVMPHLEQFNGPASGRPSGEDLGLRRGSGVTGQDGVETSEAHVQDHRILVGCDLTVDPIRRGVQHREGDPVHHEGVAGSRCLPGETEAIDGREVLEVERPAQRLPGFQHHLGLEGPGDARSPAQVIGIGVRDDQRR